MFAEFIKLDIQSGKPYHEAKPKVTTTTYSGSGGKFIKHVYMTHLL